MCLLLPITADRTPPGAAGNNSWPIQGSMPGHWWALIPSPADVINDIAHMFQQPRLLPPPSFVSTSKGSCAGKNVMHKHTQPHFRLPRKCFCQVTGCINCIVYPCLDKNRSQILTNWRQISSLFMMMHFSKYRIVILLEMCVNSLSFLASHFFLLFFLAH